MKVRIQERRNARCSNWQDSPCASVMDAWESNQLLGWDKYRWEYPLACDYPGCESRCEQSVNGKGLCNWHATEYQAFLEERGEKPCCKCMLVVHYSQQGTLVDASGSDNCEGDGIHRLADEDWTEDDLASLAEVTPSARSLSNCGRNLEGR